MPEAIEPNWWGSQAVLMGLFAIIAGLGLLIFLERTLYLHRGQIRTQDFVAGIRNLLSKGRRLEALALCEETPGPVPRILRAALLQQGQEEDRVVAAMRAAGLVELPLLERRLGTLVAFGHITPMLGLLGTILGLSRAFFALRAEGAYASWNLVTGGMAEALSTTATGLVLGILFFGAHHFLHGRLRAVIHDMEWTANEILMIQSSDLTGPTTVAEEGENSDVKPISFHPQAKPAP